MKTKIKISNKEIRELLQIDSFEFPKYSTQILNLANQNAQATRPKAVGQMSELIQEFPKKSIKEWEKWYLEKYPNALRIATDKIMDMIENFKEVLDQIDKKLIEKWVYDLVIVKTFIGLRFQEAILKRVSKLLNKKYRLASIEEEAKGIDGFIGDTPISIKSKTYKIKKNLSEKIDIKIVYYEKEKDGISIDISALIKA